jgi:hypothetical protein
VAKKFHAQAFVQSAPETAGTSLRLTALQFAAIGVPPRAKRIYQPRRRLQIEGFNEIVQPVKIRHVRQNLGSIVSEIRRVQSLPA